MADSSDEIKGFHQPNCIAGSAPCNPFTIGIEVKSMGVAHLSDLAMEDVHQVLPIHMRLFWISISTFAHTWVAAF